MLAWLTWDEHGDALEGMPPAAPPLSRDRETSRARSPGGLTHRERRILDYAELKARGFTRERAAGYMQVSQRTITRYEAALTGRVAEEPTRAA